MPEQSLLLDAMENVRRARSQAIRFRYDPNRVRYLRQYQEALTTLALVVDEARYELNERIAQLQALETGQAKG